MMCFVVTQVRMNNTIYVLGILMESKYRINALSEQLHLDECSEQLLNAIKNIYKSSLLKEQRFENKLQII